MYEDIDTNFAIILSIILPNKQAATVAAQQASNLPKYLPEGILRSASHLDWGKQQGVAGQPDRQAEKMDPTPETKAAKAERSYLTAAVESISPWGPARLSTPKPGSAANPAETSGLRNQHGGDHSTQHWHGLSLKEYPTDAPPLNARWYYAVDVPKRKPKLLSNNLKVDDKPAPPPKKFVTFSAHDSRAIEAAYQKVSDEHRDANRDAGRRDDQTGGKSTGRRSDPSSGAAGQDHKPGVKVPVHEDFLFDVDVQNRELAPVYWLGPIFEVKRGSWFYDEGNKTLRPCDENLASQLEEGYLKVMPFRYPPAPEKSSSRPTSLKPGEEPRSLAASGAFGRNRTGSGEVTPRTSAENLRQQARDETLNSPKDSPSHQPQTYRLFGTYMNSVVTYQDSTVAWLSADSLMSRVSSTVYQRFAGGGYLGGIKLVRGYSEPGKAKDPVTSDKGKSSKYSFISILTPVLPVVPSTPSSVAAKPTNAPPGLQLDERQQKLLKRRSAPPLSTASPEDPQTRAVRETAEVAAASLLRGGLDSETEAEVVRKRDEAEIQNDYNDSDGENQSREIEHLILCSHGIGQRLGMRTESVNFIHDVNVLRKTLKSVYSNSADLQALNSEIDKLPKNCRVQVLPVCWRHLLDFPKKRQNRKEHDIGTAQDYDDEYPSLEDITVEGVAFVRSLISDLALDILLYQSAYREQIINIVLTVNRIYKLFKERHPDFNGKVSLMGHSLGSAILFDLLCRQKELSGPRGSKKHRPSNSTKGQGKELDFDFDVEDFYCIGSPIGLFQMLKGRNIMGRHQEDDALPAESPLDPNYMQDPFLAASSSSRFTGEHISGITGLPLTISSPKIAQLYNIFHPSDPIAYRLEPLISPAMSSMKPQLLPYTKKNTISASVSGIGAKVGQSVSGLWSSLSSGIASSLLNRSLGLTSDDVARMEAPSIPQIRQSVGAGTNISAGGVISDIPVLQRENTNEKQRQLAENTAAADRDGSSANAPTLIDDEIETLYAGFQKRRKNHQNESVNEDWAEVEEKGKKLRREEMKVRALNSNGRVDYSIQESVLDFNPINTIASHLSYWGDEDVSHFVMSQLLSRSRQKGSKK
ncbi:putative phospholipase [Lachnellula suecica]|uniref:Putative phospholipase n=1 Tax=Lachnellula suecica TaxID=602035 RepID=A0A8T9CCE1_9HELO|nr:putative phospholipase [Lachnellula suecica]